jgi:Bax protein
MKKVISYRQKLIELARIYKIDKVFDQNLKHTTYDIEIILLKNSVPIPSRRGYFSHKFINEVFKPFYDLLKNLFFINFKINKSLKLFFLSLRKKLSVKIYVIKSLKQFLNYSLDFFKFIVSSLVNYFKFIVSSLVNYFKFIVSSIINFFKVLSNTIIESLNDIYYFKVKDKIIKNIFSKAAYASLLAALVFSGFYIKEIITDVDSVKISLEIKSDKKEKNKNLKKKEVVKKQNDTKKNNSEDLAKLQNKKETEDSVGDYNLNTQTVLNLFEDLEYDLDHVRNKKKVKPIYFTRLPKDLNSIKSVKEKKETFLQILLPLIVAENETIKKDREYLLKIIKNNESEKGKKWLNKKYRAYKVSDRNISELIKKIDIIPTSIALAQAAKESGWGTSRFALEGNAVYGQWTWNGDGIEPLEKTKDQNHKILKFPLLRASVKAYIANLNTHRGYRSFRAKRAELRKQNKKLTGIELIHELDNYAQTGKEYTKILEQIIKQNDLDELESVTIEDFKKNNQLKL